jgi:DNA-binding CsgD family transcriptional regulator
MLVGRSAELDVLADVIARGRSGGSATLVVRGEAGVGKTVLLDALVDLAHDFLVVRTEGIESELQLGYAALHRIVLPLIDQVDRLPAPQRDAIQAAFGLSASGRADRFLVGLAALTLLGDPERSAPLLVVVDDAHWLDPDSMAALAFVGRRLQADRVVLVFGVRDSFVAGLPVQGLPELLVEGLDDDAARGLLASLIATPIRAQVAAKIVAATKGNPLALTGLAGELTASQLAGLSALPDPLPAGELIEARFARQVHLLPRETQLALLLAAADPMGDPVTVGKAAEQLGTSLAALEPAEVHQLISIEHGIEFHHPLVRSAVYSSASSARRRSAHLALAAALDRATDRERWAMHTALGAVSPEEEVAAALEESATEARSRGGYTAETALLTRAADLSPAARDRSRRLLAAAHAAYLAGNAAHAFALLQTVRSGDLDDLDQARAQTLEGSVRVMLGEGWRTPALLLNAALSLAPLDAELSREVLLASLSAVLSVRQCAEGTTGREIGEAALKALGEGPEKSRVDSLLRGVASAFVCDYREAAPVLRRTLSTFEQMSPTEITEWNLVGTVLADELWDPDAYRVVVDRLETAARGQGAILALQPALLARGSEEVREGRFSVARGRYIELLEITEAVGGFTAFYALLDVELAAWEGHEEFARAKIAALIEGSTAAGTGSCILLGYMALAILELSLGRYPEALIAARALEEAREPSWSNFALPLIVEAAVRCGDTEAATKAMSQVVARAQAAQTPHALGLMWRCQALVSDHERTRAAFERAVDSFRRSPWRTELARTHLLYGEWLRRQKQRTEAREQLRTAYEMFESMGARAFAERARVELQATGEKARRRRVDAAADLTGRELQIARLAADRLTSREISSQLFISPHTVEYHLKKIFQKLGVSSRRDLAAALPTGARIDG